MKRSRSPEPFPASPTSRASLSPVANGDGPPAKIVQLDPSPENGQGSNPGDNMVMECSLPPHKYPMKFTTYKEYKTHYDSYHANRCHECHKNFPTNRILDCHIAENHDSFTAVRRERGERTYSCFKEGCEKTCRTWQKRRMHLIDKHGYPKDYFFRVARDGTDGRLFLLSDGPRDRSQCNKPSKARVLPTEPGALDPSRGSPTAAKVQDTETAAHETLAGNDGHMEMDGEALETGESQSQGTQEATGMEVNSPERPADADMDDPKETVEVEVDDAKQSADVEMNDLATAMSSLKFIPPSLRFGRRGRKGFVKR